MRGRSSTASDPVNPTTSTAAEVGSSPVDQSELARVLVGTGPTREAIQAVATAAYRGARPLDNTDMHYAWRKKMARVCVERALATVCDLSSAEGLQ